MSIDTKRALDEAVAAHVADEAGPGQVVTGYALIASNASEHDFDNDVTRYFAEYADRQPFHIALGLVHRHRLLLEAQTLAED
jgi:hypothetical protein